MWFLFSEDYYVFIEMIYVTDIHEVMLRVLIEFFVIDVMKEMNFFLRSSWNCVAISGTSTCWWIEHARVWLCHRWGCEILAFIRRSVFPRPQGWSQVDACTVTFLFRSCNRWVKKDVLFFKKKKNSSFDFNRLLLFVWVRIAHNFCNIFI